MADEPTSRPLGASAGLDGEWSFLVWAPQHEQLSLVLEPDGHAVRMTPVDRGYHVATVPDAGPSPDYRYRTSDGRDLADPASRWQPGGVHGPSRGFDPSQFRWTDDGFAPAPLAETVLYELHVGTFTDPGDFDAAIERLGALADLGVTAVEPMPLNAFPGRRNWGYDGVFPYAVQDSYGGPQGFQRFVDACHGHGLAVVLDVVYNHLGPEGNVLAEFGPYFTETYATPWGAAVNVAEAGSDEVRRYFIDNAAMWVRDFHVDGLRFDAIHGIVDPTAEPFLREMTTQLGALGTALGRRLLLIAESADNNPVVISPPRANGLGFDAQWTDDFHHAVHALLTGERDGYYCDFGAVEQLAKALDTGFVFDGQYSAFRGRRHGASAEGMPSDRFVVFAQNHDQVGNRAGAERLTALLEPAAGRLAAAILLLSPYVPLLFMGEEYGETAPFPYFVDHGDPELLAAVRSGRAEEFGREADTFDPGDEKTYQVAKLDWARRETGEGAARLSLYQTLIAARRAHPVLSDPARSGSQSHVEGNVITHMQRSSTELAFVALNAGAEATDVRLGDEAAEWRCVVDSTDPAIGGDGPRLPEQAAAGERLQLPGFGFCLYVAATMTRAA